MSEQTANPEQQAIKLSENDKETFFKCFLSETAYQEEFALFGGKFKIKFKTLSVEENEDVLKQIQLDQNNQAVENGDSYFMSILLYRLSLSIVHINGEEFQPDIAKEKYQGEGTYVAAKSDTFKSWPIFKLAGVQHAFRQFEQKVLALTNELENPSFWKAAV